RRVQDLRHDLSPDGRRPGQRHGVGQPVRVQDRVRLLGSGHRHRRGHRDLGHVLRVHQRVLPGRAARARGLLMRRRAVFTAVAAIWAVATILPVSWMALMMCKPEALMFARPPVLAFPPTLAHFDYVLAHGFVWNLLASLVVAGASTALVVLIGTPAAYALARYPIRRPPHPLPFPLAPPP